jgi:hypothetical protein
METLPGDNRTFSDDVTRNRCKSSDQPGNPHAIVPGIDSASTESLGEKNGDRGAILFTVRSVFGLEKPQAVAVKP